jgi:hypothetical protein
MGWSEIDSEGSKFPDRLAAGQLPARMRSPFERSQVASRSPLSRQSMIDAAFALAVGPAAKRFL